MKSSDDITNPIPSYFNIDSGSSDYSVTDDTEDEQDTDDDLLCMTEKEKLDTNNLAIL